MKYLIGVDEAGRGPLAGPVAVGAVMVRSNFDVRKAFPDARDSKKMTPLTREKVYSRLLEMRKAGALNFAVSFSAASAIDRYGIVPAIQAALNRALLKCTKVRPWHAKAGPSEVCHILLDGGLRAPDQFISQDTIIRGDVTEPLISLASIVAKVRRDQLMTRLARKYPDYGFEVHKGYPTRAHRTIIKERGLSEIHRRTFCRALISAKESV